MCVCVCTQRLAQYWTAIESECVCVCTQRLGQYWTAIESECVCVCTQRLAQYSTAIESIQAHNTQPVDVDDDQHVPLVKV